MNPRDDEPSTDEELTAYLSGGSALSDRYRSTATEAPSAELDRAILAQARAQATASAQPPASAPPDQVAQPATSTVVRFPQRKAVRLIVPFAVAATIVLTFSIVHQPGMEPSVTLQERKAAEPMFVPEPPPSYESRHESLANSIQQMETQGSARSEAEAKLNAGPLIEKSASLAAPAPSAPAAAPPANPPAGAAADVASTNKAENVLVDHTPAELPRAINAPLKAGNEDSFISGRLKASPSELKKTQTRERMEDSASPAVAGSARQEPVIATTTSKPPPAEAQPSGKDRAVDKVREPRVWLEDIRKLRSAGKAAEAEGELKLFLETYPDYFSKNPWVVRP